MIDKNNHLNKFHVGSENKRSTFMVLVILEGNLEPAVNDGNWFNSTVQWRHNEHDGVSNQHPYDYLLNRYSGADQRYHQNSASLAFVTGIHRSPVNSPHKNNNAEKVCIWWRHHEKKYSTWVVIQVTWPTGLILSCFPFVSVLEWPIGERGPGMGQHVSYWTGFRRGPPEKNR